MKIKIDVDFQVSARAKRLCAAVMAPCVVLGGIAIASADTPLHVWKDGDPLAADDLNANFGKLDERITVLEAAPAESAEPACPAGYTKDGSPASPFNPGSVLCKKGADEVVKVGTGGSAFWVDRYEATLWTAADGPVSGMQKFVGGADDSTVDFPKNGQATIAMFGLSVAGKDPGRSVTWFQATEACAASGKRLPTGSEWLRAARRTMDPGVNDGAANSRCNTQSAELRKTGKGLGQTEDTSCTSYWGAEDMIGNVGEWTDDWYAGVGDGGPAVQGMSNWPDVSYGGDGTWNIASSAYNGANLVPNIPAAAFRGGNWKSGVLAGIFTLDLNHSPSRWLPDVGFRCVAPR